MPKVKILSGLPGAGKTTWAKEFCKKNKDWIRVNRDDLRNMRGEYWIPRQEDLITDMERACIQMVVLSNYNLIVDATNLNPKHMEDLKFFLKRVGVYPEDIEIQFFDTPLETCIKNDLSRPNPVGEKVIHDMNARYLWSAPKPMEQDKTLPRAIIVDLDGTLAIHNGRGPFEYDKCDTDLLNESVALVVQKFFTDSRKIIYMSGREDCCKEKSEQWLRTHWLFDGLLFMRKTGDMRKDSIVKKELFDEHVKGKYYIDFVLDDRNSVVKMWREIGLTCLQVAEGNF